MQMRWKRRRCGSQALVHRVQHDQTASRRRVLLGKPGSGNYSNQNPSMCVCDYKKTHLTQGADEAEHWGALKIGVLGVDGNRVTNECAVLQWECAPLEYGRATTGFFLVTTMVTLLTPSVVTELAKTGHGVKRPAMRVPHVDSLTCQNSISVKSECACTCFSKLAFDLQSWIGRLSLTQAVQRHWAVIKLVLRCAAAVLRNSLRLHYLEVMCCRTLGYSYIPRHFVE